MKWVNVMTCHGHMWLKAKGEVGENLEELHIFQKKQGTDEKYTNSYFQASIFFTLFINMESLIGMFFNFISPHWIFLTMIAFSPDVYL